MSNKEITIPFVSRVEGHGRVTIQLDEGGHVAKSHFHVDEFRGFEKFCEGRLVSEMPVITTRICGICPVSHHLASVKAAEDAFDVTIPDAAKKLRELMHMGQFIHSHSLHFFLLAAPDFILGYDSDPAKRNAFGLIAKDPELGKKAIKIRKSGQNIIERVGGRAIHPVTAIPGGMSKSLSHEDRFNSLKEMDSSIEIALEGIKIIKDILDKNSSMVSEFAVIDTNYMGLVKDGNLEIYDGILRMINSKGDKITEFDPKNYLDYIAEKVEDWSYMKFPYYKDIGYPDGIYRVGPLARLNASDSISTPLANKELALFKNLNSGKPVNGTMYYHYARLIEMLYAAEKARELLNDDDIVSKDVRVKVERKEGEGVGVIEAPRGTLIHHYWSDFMGKIQKVNLIVSTAHNNAAIDRSVNEVAKKYINPTNGHDIDESVLNLIEMAVRCYDPCLSCATHAVGKMPLKVELISHNGNLCKIIERR